jgi:hypothetical protein
MLPRVDGDTGEPHFIVEMRTSAVSLIAHLSDRLTLAHALAFADQDLGEVGIMSFDLLAMV